MDYTCSNLIGLYTINLLNIVKSDSTLVCLFINRLYSKMNFVKIM